VLWWGGGGGGGVGGGVGSGGTWGIYPGYLGYQYGAGRGLWAHQCL